MNEVDLFKGNTSIKMFGQDYYQNTESVETVDGTESVQPVNFDMTETNTIGYTFIFLLGIIIGILVIGLLTKRWHT